MRYKTYYTKSTRGLNYVLYKITTLFAVVIYDFLINVFYVIPIRAAKSNSYVDNNNI